MLRVKNGKRNSPPSSTLPASRRPVRYWTFRLVAVTAGPLLFLSAVEVGLRLGGVGHSTRLFKTSVARPDHWVDNHRFCWLFFPPELARTPQPNLIPKQKDASTLRIVVLGASAAMGDPEAAYGLPRVLEVMLRERFPNHNFQVINAAITAINSHVVLPIVKDCQVVNPDAWVLYLGNNEVHGPYGAATVFGDRSIPRWLIRSRLAVQRLKVGQLAAFFQRRFGGDGTTPSRWGGLKMFLDHQLRHDDPQIKRVYQNFSANLADIISSATRSGVPLVVSTVPSNLTDGGPFASLHRPDLKASELEAWQAHYEAGCRAAEAKRFQEACQAFELAAEIDGTFADLQYRLGKCYRAIGEYESAAQHFRLARDYDTLRFRADTRINEMIREVVGRYAKKQRPVAGVDAVQLLDKTAENGMVGDQFFYEHVHLRFRGNYLLAKLFAEQLVDLLQLDERDSAQQVDRSWPSEERCARQLGLTPLHRRLIAREMQSRLAGAPFTNQLDHSWRQERLRQEVAELRRQMTPGMAAAAKTQFQDLLQQRPDDWILKKQFASLLESMQDLESATQQWVEITSRLPHYAEGFYKLGTLWNRRHEWEKAEAALRQSLSLRPRFARASNSLGIALSHQDRFDESYQQFKRATELRPSYAEAYTNWGLVLANQSQSHDARQRFRQAIDANPDYLRAHIELGESLIEDGLEEEAVPYYEAVARLKPDQYAAQLNLGLLYMKLNRLSKAIEPLELAVQLAPADSSYARRALAAAKRRPRSVADEAAH